MARKEKNPARLLTPANGFPRGRLIWARLFEAEAMEEGDPRFSCCILYKADQNISKIRKAIDAAVKDMGWTKLPRKAKVCLVDDDREIEDLAEEYEYIEPGDAILKLGRLEKYGRPELWDQNVEAIESPTELYSGCHVVADVEFFGWERKSSKATGVSCRLNGIQKVREDEPLGGGKLDTRKSFKEVEVENDEDDDDDDRRSRRGSKKRISRRRDDDDDDDDDDLI